MQSGGGVVGSSVSNVTVEDAGSPVGDVAIPEGVAEALVAAARDQGVALTGPGGLLTGLTKRVLESALDVELTEHLGHAAGQPAGPGGNVRNGYTPKTVRTEIGDVRVQVPRDRAGSFDPVIVCEARPPFGGIRRVGHQPVRQGNDHR